MMRRAARVGDVYQNLRDGRRVRLVATMRLGTVPLGRLWNMNTGRGSTVMLERLPYWPWVLEGGDRLDKRDVAPGLGTTPANPPVPTLRGHS